MYREKFGELKAHATYQQPSYINWDDEKYQGDAYGAYAWAVYVADVSVDLTTYEVKVEDFVALQEVGKVVHPILAAGQIEGGVAQGIGYAIHEKCVYRDGHLANNRMTNYIVPTAADTPPIRMWMLRGCALSTRWRLTVRKPSSTPRFTVSPVSDPRRSMTGWATSRSPKRPAARLPTANRR